MRVLVTGGAGYIGSVTAEVLLDAGHKVAAVDSLVEGHRQAVHPQATFFHVDVGDREGISSVFDSFQPEAVIHLAASTLVSESMTDPGKYFLQNVEKGRVLLETMVAHRVHRIVFSSTAAVYGEPTRTPIVEGDSLQPTNPYGESKLAFERLLRWYGEIHGVRYLCLRYFNAAGATDRCGEDHDPETHLIPRVLRVALGTLPELEVFGTDYPTRDGSCIRDYVHVLDLADAHRRALERLGNGDLGGAINLGNGEGYSVLEVVRTVEEVAGRKIATRRAPRRPGDPAVLVASSARARELLGWRAARPDLATIVENAWQWQRAHPNGYGNG